MKMNEPTGFTGEWIVRVQGLSGPEDANAVWDKVIGAIRDAGILHKTDVVFDASRWKGGDF